MALVIVILDIACIVVCTIIAVHSAVQKKWMVAALWTFGALFWVGTAILNVQSPVMIGY